MRSFEIEYPLDVLIADSTIVTTYKVKDRVIISGTKEYYAFYAVYAYTKTDDGIDWYRLIQLQQSRIQNE